MTKLEKLKKLLAYIERALDGKYGPLTAEDKSLLEVWKEDLLKEIKELESEPEPESESEPKPNLTSGLTPGSKPGFKR